jgi:hypothetical protein
VDHRLPCSIALAGTVIPRGVYIVTRKTAP